MKYVISENQYTILLREDRVDFLKKPHTQAYADNSFSSRMRLASLARYCFYIKAIKNSI